MFNEAEIVKFLRKNASRADYILAGKKRIFIIQGIWRISYRFIPVIYGLCALMGWSLNPAEWGLFVRCFGVFGIAFLCVFAHVIGSVFLDDAKIWLKLHGKDAIFTE